MAAVRLSAAPTCCPSLSAPVMSPETVAPAVMVHPHCWRSASALPPPPASSPVSSLCSVRPETRPLTQRPHPCKQEVTTTYNHNNHCSNESPLLVSSGVVIVTVAVRHRKREPLTMDDARGIRENIVHYDDEGGGEEDTEAFDMLTLRHLNKTKPTHQDQDQNPQRLYSRTLEYRADKDRVFQEFIRDRLQDADLDLKAPPYDSLQTYAFEGSGSAAESLSSLNSKNSLESEQNYDFLRAWGPRFRKLADLYGNHEGGGGDTSPSDSPCDRCVKTTGTGVWLK